MQKQSEGRLGPTLTNSPHLRPILNVGQKVGGGHNNLRTA